MFSLELNCGLLGSTRLSQILILLWLILICGWILAKMEPLVLDLMITLGVGDKFQKLMCIMICNCGWDISLSLWLILSTNYKYRQAKIYQSFQAMITEIYLVKFSSSTETGVTMNKLVFTLIESYIMTTQLLRKH